MSLVNTARSSWVLTDLEQASAVLLADGEWHALSGVEIGDFEYLSGKESAFRVTPKQRQPGISWTENGQRISCPISSVLAVRQDRE